MACEIALGNVHYGHYNHYNDSNYCNDFTDTGLLLRLSLMFKIHPTIIFFPHLNYPEQEKYYKMSHTLSALIYLICVTSLKKKNLIKF